MTREEKLEAIYDEIDRTIVFFNQFGGIEFDWDWENYEFLPIMIWDAIDWIENKKFDVNAPIMWFWFEDEDYDNDTKLYFIQRHYSEKTCAIWESKRLPIEDQSDECIDFIYSLIKK